MDLNPQRSDNDPAWERKTLEKLAFAALSEQRARRRWGVFFKLLGFGYVAFILFALIEWDSSKVADKHVAMVELRGVIAAKGEASADSLVSALNSAFDAPNSQAVVLRINSPGGSPVQAGIVNDEIRRLRAKYPDKPLYAVVEDVCASGGYYVAAAADQIYVDKASVVGSIGVLMDGFGFTGTMEKLGVERRLLTAGDNKGFLDPFSPQDEAQRAHARTLLADIHAQFIDVVKKGRGERLKDNPDIFSGLMWTGAQSIQLGLADGFGTVESVARDVVKVEDVLDYSVKENLAERFAKRLGAGAVDSFWRGLSSSTGDFRLN
ncbi:S49 family peptidase [uncultured Azonexus sp.]|uniref:S49 family peptidase n=1 Tax=uncultured Azonexus sp. TaxID=520307 RepID=UPI00262D5E0E|nr:S49 family peptidase [uncultured Azonexus sp.]